jgi:hypothetical protein
MHVEKQEKIRPDFDVSLEIAITFKNKGLNQHLTRCSNDLVTAKTLSQNVYKRDYSYSPIGKRGLITISIEPRRIFQKTFILSRVLVILFEGVFW